MKRIKRGDLYPSAVDEAGNIPKGLRHSALRCRDEGTATLGGELKLEINFEGVESNCGGGDATALWLMVFLNDDPGQSLRTNPGLDDGIPLGFKRRNLAAYETGAKTSTTNSRQFLISPSSNSNNRLALSFSLPSHVETKLSDCCLYVASFLRN